MQILGSLTYYRRSVQLLQSELFEWFIRQKQVTLSDYATKLHFAIVKAKGKARQTEQVYCNGYIHMWYLPGCVQAH